VAGPFAAQALLGLWAVPPDDRPDPEAAFAAVYTNPVLINGTPMSVPDVVQRARDLHSAFSDLSTEVVDQVQTPGKLAIAFRQTGRHTGPWRTPLGEVPATGRTVHGLGIDILTITDGRISEIWVLADELQRLMQTAAVSVAKASSHSNG
jgi:hypothetical protein